MVTRNLSDLYRKGKATVVKGTITEIDKDGNVSTEEVEDEVWIEKLKAFHAEKALKAANARRSIRFATLRDQQSEDYLSIQSDSWTKSKDELREEVAAEDLANKYQAIEAELSHEDKWAKNDYLEGLRTSWETDLAFKYAENNEDPEAKKVFDILSEFAEEAAKRYEVEKLDIIASLDQYSEDQLRQKWVEKRVEQDANEVWFIEYKYQEILYSTRQVNDHNKMYFGSRADLDELDREVIVQLISAYNALNVDVSEGKDSPQTPPSSPSSDSAENPATVEVSGQLAVTP